VAIANQEVETFLLANSTIIIFILAAILDWVIGDPVNWLHPVQIMGKAISLLTNLTLRFCPWNWQRRLGGILIGLLLIIGSGAIAWLLIFSANKIHSLLACAIQIVILASCFALKSLRLAAREVISSLKTNGEDEAREKLSKYVGRDTTNLEESEILRAVLETVAENAVDGVMAPLFYAILGGFFPAIGSVPFAIAYKAASTLDSMVGYRQEPYTYLGWFSARSEDILTWFPCRLTVVSLALIAGKPLKVWNLCHRDAHRDPSPNSGWSECTYAAILGVQLGGINYYQGVPKEKPLLGDRDREIDSQAITRALNLTEICFIVWLAIAIVLLSV
jgi:adenosylcobinamide-phosphate synthase